MEVMPGYKQTEVGIIPEEWETPTVLGVSRQIIDYRGRTPRKLGMDWGGGDIPALSAGNVRMGFIDFSEECYFGSEALYKRWMTKGEVAKDDIAFTTEAPLGNVALIPDGRKYILSQRTVLLQIDPAQAVSRFLFQLMLSEQFQKVLADHSSGTTAKGIQRKKFEQLRLACPPLPEQRAIATVLSDVDALLGGLERLISKKRDLKQAAMQQLLTGQTRLPGFHGEWEVKSLAAVCSMKSGEGITSADIDGFSKYPCYGGNGVRGFTSRFTHDGSYALIGRQGALCGNVFGVEGQFFASEHAIVVTPSAKTDIRWLTCVLGRMNLNQYSESSPQPGLSVSKILILEVTAPPTKAEQTAIAAVLSDMDAELALLTQRLTKTRALKQGMMQELLTGRTRLV